MILLFAPVSRVIDAAPVIDQDWGLHFHHLQSLEAFWRQDRLLWGYNPLFMAGYPSNTIQDLSIKLFECAALTLSWFALAPIQWFKILAFLAVACVPWLVYFAARNVWDDDDLNLAVPPIAALLGTAYWWNSLPREMFFYGMLGYPMACYVALWGVSLIYGLSRQPALRPSAPRQSAWSPAHVGWVACALILPPLHVQAAIIVIPPLLALLCVQPRLLRSWFLFWVCAAAALSLAVNLVWLAPAVSHLQDDVSASIVEQLPLFVSADPLTFVKDYLGPRGYWTFRTAWAEKGLRLTILALGVLGIMKLLRGSYKSAGVMIAAAVITLFLISYFGSLVPALEAWQPLRFKVACDLFLLLAASYAAACRVHKPFPMRSAVFALAVIFGATMFVVNVSVTESMGKMRLRTGLPTELQRIIDWMKTATPANARILFEESGDESGFVYDGVYLSSFAAHRAVRQLIGGPINLYNDRHHFAEFHSGRLFGRDIQRLSDEELRSYFRLYNIGAVVAFHPASIRRLLSVAGLVSLKERVGPVHLMTVNQPPSWFLRGEGNVAAELGRLRVSNVRGRDIILKYHWVEGLQGSPNVKIVPVKMLDDPIPFIEIVDPPSDFILKIAK